MTITFEAHPIGTAPKDRDYYALSRFGDWHRVRLYGRTQFYYGCDGLKYSYEQIIRMFTHWCEIEAMRPGGGE